MSLRTIFSEDFEDRNALLKADGNDFGDEIV